MKYLYGIDVGGTTSKIGFFNLNGVLLEKFMIPTDTSNNGANILDNIIHSINSHIESKHLNKDSIFGIGIGVPGPVVNGVVYGCVNLGWGTTNVLEYLENRLGLKVSVGNDANMAGLGEMWQGSGRIYSNLVFITIGTGVGGAIIIDNKIVEGSTGASGEIGHIETLDNYFKCHCGKTGCLETVSSATGIVNVAHKLMQEKRIDSRLYMYHNLNAEIIFTEAKKNDPLALEVVDIFGKNLAYVCAAIGVITNPEAFIIGGGVANTGSIVISYIQKYFKEFAFPNIINNTEFKLAKLGNDAGIFGAAYLAKREGGLCV
ncbi:MAG TPA: ROK family glucokinase [Haloplasmataceae bacterium]